MPDTKDAVSQRGQTADSESAAGVENYRSQLQAWIIDFHAYPKRALRRKLTGVVLAEFTIDDNGLVINTRVLKSSGASLLDKAALNTLTKASPMPVPPDDVSARSFPVPLSFKLN
ncbi:MAG: protein TonB [Granulosicoccus sp.]|jgi:protein TonB